MPRVEQLLLWRLAERGEGASWFKAKEDTADMIFPLKEIRLSSETEGGEEQALGI